MVLVELEVLGIPSKIVGVLGVDDLELELGWVLVGSAGEVEVELEVVHCLVRRALVHELPFRHQKQSVELAVDISVGLVNGHQHCSPLLVRQLVQVVNYDEGSEGVQP